jgi:5-deoxy-D-glucuronate isomerase
MSIVKGVDLSVEGNIKAAERALGIKRKGTRVPSGKGKSVDIIYLPNQRQVDIMACEGRIKLNDSTR